MEPYIAFLLGSLLVLLILVVFNFLATVNASVSQSYSNTFCANLK
jgi:hypothetical protein